MKKSRVLIGSSMLAVALAFAFIIEILTLSPQSLSAAVSGSSSGLIAHYSFENISGVTTPDTSATGGTGTLVNGPTVIAGKIGSKALLFDGVDDRVDIGTDIMASGDRTVCAWIKPSANFSSGFMSVVDSVFFALNLFWAGGPYASITNNSQGAVYVGYSAPLDTWIHYCGTRTGDGAGGGLFFNGARVATGGTGAPGSAFQLSIGGRTQGGTYWNGALDDVRIYNRVLTDGEIAEVYNLANSTDTTAPSVTITSPSNGTQVSGTVSITATASDNVGVGGVQFKVNGVNLGTEDTSAPYTASWNSSTLTTMNHTITAIARDTSDNLTSTQIAVTIPDATKPVITSIRAAASGTNGMVITWTTDEPTDATVRFGVDTLYSGAPVTRTTLAPSHSLTVSGLTQGTTYHYKVISKDAAGNLSESTDKTYLVRTTATSGEIIPPERVVPWVPGVNVGVPGGIASKSAGRTNIINVTEAPYNASRSLVTTTGSINNGTNQLVVTDIKDFKVGQLIVIIDGLPYGGTKIPLHTTITAISGNTIAISDTATITTLNTKVAHDDHRAINDAIRNAPANSVVYLPAGTYPIYSGINSGYKKNITFRGDGDTTVLVGFNNTVMIWGGGGAYRWNYPNLDITGSPKRGPSAGQSCDCTVLTVGDTSALTVGYMVNINLSRDDRELPVVYFGDAQGFRRQTTRIISKTANTVTVSPALHFDLPASLLPKLNIVDDQAEFIGLENFKVDMSNNPTGFAIILEQAYGSWIKNVTTMNTPGHHIYVLDSLQCEMRGSYISKRQRFGTNGSGVIVEHTSNCLFEDNILDDVTPLFEINYGASGNVFTYNFLNSNVLIGFDMNHGPHNSYNIVEGNISPGFTSDGYFGGSSEDTAFRNWFKGDGGYRSYTVSLQRFTRNASIVGNILGKPGYAGEGVSFGLPNMGNGSYSGSFQLSAGDPMPSFSGGSNCCQQLDLDVEATTLLWGNYDYLKGSIQFNPDEVPASMSVPTTQTLPASLVYTSKPSWWPGSMTWPPIDPNNPNITNDVIPAGYRFSHGVAPTTISVEPPTTPVLDTPGNTGTTGTSPNNVTGIAQNNNGGGGGGGSNGNSGVSNPVTPNTVPCTPSSVASPFTRTLQLGSAGIDVKTLQQFLNQNGFKIVATGTGSPGRESTYFGPATKAAVIRFQTANNIKPASGSFGPLTRAKVNQLRGTSNACAPSVPAAASSGTSQFLRTLQLGSTGADVRALQQFLNREGFTVSTVGGGSVGFETSYFGPKMKAALIRFQVANNIKPTSGVFGPITRGKVNAIR